ncbi:ribbon-helix-helix protein, CopG family [Roseovarius sp. B08]|uniref:ribbon-helix-helix protein, CopG family n=1 Tax=Roseovarius sp. B08 TaxID=3449223 RepID=UPI003EDC6D60
MTDRRRQCRASPPDRIGRPVTVHLSADDYRDLYELTMTRGGSMSDALRDLVRAETARKPTVSDQGENL